MGDKNSCHVDYAIISLEELICITERWVTGYCFGNYEYLYGVITIASEWYFLSYSLEKISCTFKNPIILKFSKTVITDSKEESELRNVKQVLEIIVGLLKDRLENESFKEQKTIRTYTVLLCMIRV
ncbi:hypothetical protein GLOIN_2v1780729 [Rhizophagus clarus]|uniref:Uncharacterized protein n=1 Tax=Rhizophagus clarus TaxID=94130 RepID=A0A8H3LQE2_9GLOM|nr:hypothetical protein GLOIN_2v1780729 [Rhizophagus clarus]